MTDGLIYLFVWLNTINIVLYISHITQTNSTPLKGLDSYYESQIK